jgi:TPR repeat protein
MFFLMLRCILRSQIDFFFSFTKQHNGAKFCFQADGHQLAKEFDSHPKHNLYLQGLAFEKSQNFSLARDFYELAREGPTQHPSACARLWDFFQFGRPGIPLNFDRAYNCAKSGARSSCAHCTGALSLHMAFGWGMSAQDRCSGIEKIDVPQAVRLATASAQEDSAYGHYALATFYFGGIGVVQSDKNMFSMYSKAALQGLGRAKLALGSCFMHGIGVHMNLRLAAMHFEDASTSGVLGAALLLQNVIDRFDEQMN